MRAKVPSSAGSASRRASAISCASALRNSERSNHNTMTEIAEKQEPRQRSRTGASAKRPVALAEHVIEVISDSGEGAQRCGQSLGAIAARMGNGVWNVEIIPAEIRPPARSVAGASGNRIRLGAKRVSNGGDQTDL